MPKLGRGQLRSSSLSTSIPGVPEKFVSGLKLILFFLLLPVALGNYYGLLRTLSALENGWLNIFWAGIFIFFIVDLVVYKLTPVYKNGQGLVTIIFRFFSPMVKFAPYVLPIYTIFVLLLSLIIAQFGGLSLYQKPLVFLTSFTMILHLVYTAGALREREGGFLRGGYFFAILLIYLANMMILAFTISRILPEFTFLDFFRNSCAATKEIFNALTNQLFRV